MTHESYTNQRCLRCGADVWGWLGYCRDCLKRRRHGDYDQDHPVRDYSNERPVPYHMIDVPPVSGERRIVHANDQGDDGLSAVAPASSLAELFRAPALSIMWY